MEIHKMVKDALRDHKEKIELLQWAIISGIATLIYPEYLIRIKQKRTPVRRILLPPIKSVREIVHPEGEFMTYLSEHLIESIKSRLNTPQFREYASAPEFALFCSNHDEIEILKTIFDLYMIPNISTRLPETISRKFQIDDPKQQLMVESSDIDLFDRKCPVDELSFDFLVEEIVLQLLTLIPTMKKEVELPESNIGIYLTESEVVTIGNENGICPIHINKHIIENSGVRFNVLRFVTNTNIEKTDWQENSMVKDDECVEYKMETGLFNQVAITRFKGISVGESSEEKTDN